MNQWKKYGYPIVHTICLVITIIFDAIMYPRLPEKIATQISTHGELANVMPKWIYMMITVGILLLLFAFGNLKEKSVKIKYSVIAGIIVIANIVILVVQ
ncbi:MAG: hypothetical protein H6Q59_899 [Firmicutes bacterium]|nr:hypothetical protein [Bacillota bacterium]